MLPNMKGARGGGVADAIRLGSRLGRFTWGIRQSPKSNHKCPSIRGRERCDRQEETAGTREVGTGIRSPQLNRASHRGSVALPTSWFSPSDANVWRTASKTERKYTSVVSSRQVSGSLVQYPQEAKRDSYFTKSIYRIYSKLKLYKNVIIVQS